MDIIRDQKCDHCTATTVRAKADGWAVVTVEVVRWLLDDEAEDGLRQDVQRIMDLLCPVCADSALKVMGKGQHGQGRSNDQAATGAVRPTVRAGKGGDRNG